MIILKKAGCAHGEGNRGSVWSKRLGVPVDSEAFLVIDFVNFKIKSVQSFEGAHRDRVCIHVFIEVNTYIYINIYIYTVF
jgi:hypothetical protein